MFSVFRKKIFQEFQAQFEKQRNRSRQLKNSEGRYLKFYKFVFSEIEEPIFGVFACGYLYLYGLCTSTTYTSFVYICHRNTRLVYFPEGACIYKEYSHHSGIMTTCIYEYTVAVMPKRYIISCRHSARCILNSVYLLIF